MAHMPARLAKVESTQAQMAAMAFRGGYLIVALGYRTLFLVAAGLALAGALIFFAYFHVPRGALARVPAPEKIVSSPKDLHP